MMVRFGSLILIIFSCAELFAAPSNFAYQGQIIKPNGAPLEAASVTFTIDVLSHGAEQCLLYQERHVLNMTSSNGIFNFEVGSGSRTGADYEDTNSLANALSNSTGLVTPTTCASVGTYNPGVNHGRKLRVTFNDGSGPITLAQMHNIVSVPYATNASSIDGLTPGDLLTINTTGTYVLTQANLENIFDTANHNELLALLGGTSTLYLQSSPSADFDMNSNKIVNVADPTLGTDAANRNYVDANIGGHGVDTVDLAALTVGNAGEVLTWDGNQWVSQAASATDNTKLPLAGGTMSGAIDMGNENISNADNISANANISATGNVAATINLSAGQDLTVGDDATITGDLGVGNNLTITNDATVTNNLTVGNDVLITGGIGVGTGINSAGTISLTSGNEINFRDADDSNFVGFAAPAIVGTDQIWTLPAADGLANQVLQTDGSGLLSWASFPASGEVNTASNVGVGGIAVYKQKTGVNLEFKSVNAASTKVTVVNDGPNNEIDINVDETQFALSSIPNTPAGDIAATNAQAAINELDTDKVATTRTVGTAADSGLTGGGDLSANRSLSLDIPGTTDLGAAADNADSILVYDASGTAIREVTRAQFNLSEAEVDAFVSDNGYAADADKVDRAGDTMTGALIMDATGAGAGTGGTISFKDLAANGGDAVGFRAPDDVTTSVIWQLPAADGTSGQVLQTNGSGILTWVAQTSGADNLGNHTATTDLNLADYSILNLEGGSASAPGLSFNSDPNTGLFSAGVDTLSLSTAGTEALTILADGNVGIGTTTPSSTLNVNGVLTVNGSTQSIWGDSGSDYTLRRAGNSNSIEIAGGNGIATGANIRLFGSTNGTNPDTVQFRSNSVETMRIDGSGNVGIGTTSPDYLLDVSGTANATALNISGGAAIESTRKFVANLGTVSSPGYRFQGDGNSGFWSPADNIIAASTDGGERLRIDGSGNVGIGTTSPGDLLHVYKSSGSLDVTFETASGSGIVETELIANSRKAGMRMHGNGHGTFPNVMHVGTVSGTGGAGQLGFTVGDNVERVRIDATGNVGIGTTNPGYKLDVSGDLRITGTPYRTGGDIAWQVPSDARLKDVTGPYEHGLEALTTLDMIRFRYKENNPVGADISKEYIGVLAQNVQKVIPEAVNEDKEGFLSLNTTPIFWSMINAIKELYNRILGIESHQATQDRQIASKADKTEIEALKAKNQKLEQENAIKAKELEAIKQDNAEMKARLDKIEKMLNSK